MKRLLFFAFLFASLSAFSQGKKSDGAEKKAVDTSKKITAPVEQQERMWVVQIPQSGIQIFLNVIERSNAPYDTEVKPIKEGILYQLRFQDSVYKSKQIPSSAPKK